MEVAGGKVYHAFGTYREVDFPRRLVYTWDLEEAEDWVGETLVTVEFLPEGEATRCPNRSACQRPQQPAGIDRRNTEVHGQVPLLPGTASQNRTRRNDAQQEVSPSETPPPIHPQQPAEAALPEAWPEDSPGEAAQALAAEVKRVRRSGR